MTTTRRYKVHLQRRTKKGILRKTIFTHAVSVRQARRFASVRQPGYSITRVVRD